MVLPAGSPPCAALTLTCSAVTDAWAAGGPFFRVPPDVESTVSVPQSSSEAVVPGVLATSCPSARRPCSSDADVSEPTDRSLAPAETAAVTLPATISPLKSDTTIASADAWVAAADPGDANPAARERPMLTMEPSAGYWKDCTSAMVDVGHSRSPRDTPLWPGIVMRRRKALAPVSALRGGGAADAIAVKSATAAMTAT